MTEKLAELILLDKFRREPFHNLYLLNKVQPSITAYGGTCSDKALSYLEAALAAGLDAHLHSARINGQENHRLVRLEIGNQRYFADVGNGWPSIKLFSAVSPVSYECYGMRYKTIVESGVLKIYLLKQGVEKQQMEIDTAAKPEAEIRQGISNRFSSNIIYPFNKQLRFSMIVDSRFLFIRGSRLEIYSKHGYEEVSDISASDLEKVLMKYFGFDIKPIQSTFRKHKPRQYFYCEE